MFVIIAGGGRVGSTLAHDLLEHGHQIAVIEDRPDVLEHLHREIPTHAIHVGECTHPDVLEAAGIQKADVVAAVYAKDQDNLAVACLSRFHYAVPRIIARVNNPRSAWLFTPEMGVDVGLNQVEIVGSLIREEMSMGDMMTILKLRQGQFSLVEEKIPPGARAAGMSIVEMQLPDECVISVIIREGKIVIPHGQVRLEAGDQIIALTDPEGAAMLSKFFADPRR